jgi:hypothetical protein
MEASPWGRAFPIISRRALRGAARNEEQRLPVQLADAKSCSLNTSVISMIAAPPEITE